MVSNEDILFECAFLQLVVVDYATLLISVSYSLSLSLSYVIIHISRLLCRNFDGAFIVTSTGEVSHVSTKDVDVEEEIRELLGIGHDEL